LAGYTDGSKFVRTVLNAHSARPQASLPAADGRPRHSHIFERDPHGHYIEPAWISRRLFEAVDFGPKHAQVLDPCCGWGTILRSACNAGFSPLGADIVDRRNDPLAFADFPFVVSDFLDSSGIPGRVWSVVCNPPFDKGREFSERALEVARFKVAILTPLRRLPAARWLNRLPLEAVYVLTPRPSMPPASYLSAGEKPGGGKQDFVWLIFSRQINIGREPRIRWLHPDGGRR
jgi:hypothetical protein